MGPKIFVDVLWIFTQVPRQWAYLRIRPWPLPSISLPIQHASKQSLDTAYTELSKKITLLLLLLLL